MVRPGGDHVRHNAQDLARMRPLEDAVLALADNANNAGGQRQTIFDRFDRHRPPTYDGTLDPVVLEAWFREMEKLFTATLCPEDQKVGIATYYLKREADNWWSISRAAIQLEQESLSVQAYADKFMELSRFATTIVPDEASRVRRFEKNLTPKVRTVLTGIPSTTFQQAYDRALSVHESVKAEAAETAKRVEKRPFVPHSSFQGTKKAKFVARPSSDRASGAPPMICYRCRKPYHAD
ncbi:hypothetical protein RND81_13G094600 [Saponaria officinalis]|uniref:Retrotransposon gag domain-containing protein n=1 Tax=Saponaria officinalis TaxID=3572 RepID=A0AAW1H5D4_SAPOF